LYDVHFFTCFFFVTAQAIHGNPFAPVGAVSC